jgi:hypothetical protein
MAACDSTNNLHFLANQTSKFTIATTEISHCNMSKQQMKHKTKAIKQSIVLLYFDLSILTSLVTFSNI